MAEWVTAEEFKEWSSMSKVAASDPGTLDRAIRRARLNIISLLHKEPSPVSESVREANLIVAERIILGADEVSIATSARGLSGAQSGDHSISLGQSQNPFITAEVLELLKDEISGFALEALQTDKVIVRGDVGYYTTEDDSDVDYTSGQIMTEEDNPYPHIL